MAHHNRTPQSVLDAPSPSMVSITTPAGPNRKRRRATDRQLRMSGPRRVPAVRVRPERIVTEQAVTERAARRAAAQAARTRRFGALS